MSTVVGLPQFMVLKSKSDGKYLHYLWNDESFGPYVNDLGCKHNLDPVNPFVKLEVIPSSTNPTQMVHLRCPHNNKYLKLDSKYGVSWISATGTAPDERSTLFRPVFPPGEPHTVGLLHVQTNCHVRIFYNQGYNADINGVACAYSNDGADGMHRFEFAAWESYDDKIRKLTSEMRSGKDGEIQRMRASHVAEIQRVKLAYEEKVKGKEGEIERMRASHVADVNGKEGEIRRMKLSYEEKMKAKDDEIQKLKSQGKVDGGDDDDCQQADDIVAELRMEIAELKVQLDDACKENEDLKAAAGGGK